MKNLTGRLQCMARWPLPILITIFILACASIPSPKDGNDTMLIVPVSFTSVAGAQWGYYFSFELAGVPWHFSVSPTTRRYVAVTGLPAGAYTLSQVTLLPMATSYINHATENTYKTPAAPVDLKAGAATMAAFFLEARMNEVGPHRFQQSWKIRTATATEREAIREDLEAERSFAGWENRLGD